MSPSKTVGGFTGEPVYGGGGEWRYDHPSGAVVWVAPDPESGAPISRGPGPTRSRVERGVRRLLEGGPPTAAEKRRRRMSERLTRWIAMGQTADGGHEVIADGAPKDEAFRLAYQWMRARGSDEEFEAGWF